MNDPSMLRSTDDLQLAAAARDGDRAALEALLGRHHERIASICRRVTGNPADGADATQEALLSIVRGLPRFDGRSSFTTWSYRIAVNASLDELRRRRRRAVPMAVDGAGVGDSDAERPPVRLHDVSATDALNDAEFRLDLDQALTRIAPEFRAALVLRDVCGMDYAEIGEVLGIPGGTVRSRIARGRVALAAELQPEDLVAVSVMPYSASAAEVHDAGRKGDRSVVGRSASGVKVAPRSVRAAGRSTLGAATRPNRELPAARPTSDPVSDTAATNALSPKPEPPQTPEPPRTPEPPKHLSPPNT